MKFHSNLHGVSIALAAGRYQTRLIILHDAAPLNLTITSVAVSQRLRSLSYEFEILRRKFYRSTT